MFKVCLIGNSVLVQRDVGKINEAMLILYWIAIAEAGKPYPKDYSRYVNATSRKRVEIQAYWVSQNEKPFASETLSQY